MNPNTHTHYVPALTQFDQAGRMRTVCGAFVTNDQRAPLGHLPTCWGCKVWIENLDVIEPAGMPAERLTA